MKARQLERQLAEQEQREQEESWLASCDKLLPALDMYHTAEQQLALYRPDDQTAAATAARAYFQKARQRVSEIWYQMTGRIWTGEQQQGVTPDVG